MKPEEPISSETVFEGKIIRVRVDTVRLSSGRRATREVVEHAPSVVVVPINSNDNVVLVRQYRHPIGLALLEAPAGGVEDSESPEECAQRELREETGYAAGSLRALGQFWASPGYCSELLYAFVATDLTPSPLEPDQDEDIRVETVPLSRVVELVRGGQIQDGKTVAALLMAADALGQG